MQYRLLADGPVDQGRRHSGIHAARKPTDHFCIPDFGPELLHRGLHEVGGGPITLQSTDIVEEVADDLATMGRMRDFRVKLEGVGKQALIFKCAGSDGGRARNGLETVGQFGDGIAMAHPNLALGRNAFEEPGRLMDFELSAAKFTAATGFHPSIELMGNELCTIADAQNGDLS
jgi:hypothetical protein